MDWDEVRSRLRGPGALISTIFHDDYTLDLKALEANVRHIVDLGIGKKTGYLIAPCGDGEYVTLSPEEHRLVVETAVRASDGTVPVVAGVQSTDYRLAASLAQGARDAGAVAVMLAPPMYYPLHEEAIIDFYRRFAGSVDIGIMVYEQAWRGPFVNAYISADAVGRLLEIPNFVAMKHSGLFNLVDEFTILDRYHDRLDVYGHDRVLRHDDRAYARSRGLGQRARDMVARLRAPLLGWPGGRRLQASPVGACTPQSTARIHVRQRAAERGHLTEQHPQGCSRLRGARWRGLAAAIPVARGVRACAPVRRAGRLEIPGAAAQRG